MESQLDMRFLISVSLLLIGILWIVWTASAQANDSFNLSWYAVEGGGGQSVGGTFTLRGSIGQPNAGNELQGGEFTLERGFQVASEVGTTQLPVSNLWALVVLSAGFGVFLIWGLRRMEMQ